MFARISDSSLHIWVSRLARGHSDLADTPGTACLRRHAALHTRAAMRRPLLDRVEEDTAPRAPLACASALVTPECVLAGERLAARVARAHNVVVEDDVLAEVGGRLGAAAPAALPSLGDLARVRGLEVLRDRCRVDDGTTSIPLARYSRNVDVGRDGRKSSGSGRGRGRDAPVEGHRGRGSSERRRCRVPQMEAQRRRGRGEQILVRQRREVVEEEHVARVRKSRHVPDGIDPQV
jgi:hypothetical protein